MAYIIQRIEEKKGEEVLMVGIDGVDASGKTRFAGKLSEELRKRNHKVIEGSMDGFHNPRKIRYQRGRDSSEGYYRDSFNIEALKNHLLEPLQNGLPHRTKIFNYRSDSPIDTPQRESPQTAILVFEGVFCLRPELRHYWDIMIYLNISPEESLRRGILRDPGEKEEIMQRYRVRYLPGQQLYKTETHPLEAAHIIVDYNDPTNPKI